MNRVQHRINGYLKRQWLNILGRKTDAWHEHPVEFVVHGRGIEKVLV